MMTRLRYIYHSLSGLKVKGESMGGEKIEGGQSL